MDESRHHRAMAECGRKATIEDGDGRLIENCHCRLVEPQRIKLVVQNGNGGLIEDGHSRLIEVCDLGRSAREIACEVVSGNEHVFEGWMFLINSRIDDCNDAGASRKTALGLG